jgi:hypothetical protein
MNKQINSFVTTYNFSLSVHLVTITHINSSVAIDDIFLDRTRSNSNLTSPTISGLSEYENQFIKKNNERVMQFQLLLKNETSESVYKGNRPSNKFNTFSYSFCVSVTLIT